jgi:hypothetical protein
MRKLGLNRCDRQKFLFGCLSLTIAFAAIIAPSSANTKSTAKDNDKERCMTAINSVVEEIGSFGTPVYLKKDYEANRYHSGNPSDRKGYLSIVLGNLRGVKDYTLAFRSNTEPSRVYYIIENIMNSVALQKKWANYLAKNCSDLAVMSLNEAHTDSVVEYAIQADNTMRLRDCIETLGRDRILDWNEKVCL